MSHQREIAIVLSTYNGEKYLNEQMDSFSAQTFIGWKLFVRDDKSSDGTLKNLNEYKLKFPDKINIITDDFGNIGIKKSYSELIKHVKDFDYVAFADQDDVWSPEKLEILLKRMKEIEKANHLPVAVFSDLEIVDEKLKTISESFFTFTKLSPKIVDSNVLIFRNVVPGCSMMINKKLNSIIHEIPEEAVMHDYWIVLVAHFLGKISFVNLPLVKYRQHGKNSLGAEKRTEKNIFSVCRLFFQTIKNENNYLNNFLVYIKQLEVFYKLFSEKIYDKNVIEAVISLPAERNFLKRKYIAVKYGLGYGNRLMNLEFILCC